MSVLSVYTRRKEGYNGEAKGLLSEIRGFLGLEAVTAVHIFNRYDVEGISNEDFENAIPTIFMEPPVDDCYKTLPEFIGAHRVLATEYLPGQYDQRADSAAQCIQLATMRERPTVVTARIYVFEGDITKGDFAKIKGFIINAVESRECEVTAPKTLVMEMPEPGDVAVLEGFSATTDTKAALKEHSLAMDEADLICVRDYFKSEGREPTETELRVIDTYWSDHCRHTTFHTKLEDIEIEDEAVKAAFEEYLSIKGDKPVTLMNLATIGAKTLKKRGLLDFIDESEEVNACSIKVKAKFPEGERDYLVMFKNETHNHPTEIEPFGGAATCLGGAIRDPLSGRAYVYQAMRVTGAGNPLTPAEQTLKGKLPQKKLTQTACAGYSSYGNQIGLTTGLVDEIYHDGYVAKRMEVGAVIAAAPAENVIRSVPEEGDIVILLGGRTGRDGCGGATGSSKSHTEESLTTCGAEVQKGNAPEERKIQRLFRDGEVTKLIKRCNDFGAGGVSVAIGELCDGLDINLDAVPKKYEGLTGTELAVSESQERMAVVVRADDADKFMEMAARENLESTIVATVTADSRLVMRFRGKKIVDISRDFLNTNGAPKSAKVKVLPQEALPVGIKPIGETSADKLKNLLQDLNVASKRGLLERFDNSVGAATVLIPQGGKHQVTPIQAMAARLPSDKNDCETASLMSYGFNPYISEKNQYIGAMWAVVESMCKLIATGGSRKGAAMSFQEYFGSIRGDASRIGKPFAALLGALKAQLGLEVGAIGGKDSMSGSFEDLDVPPTLISFAVSTTPAAEVLSPEFKEVGESVYLLAPTIKPNGEPDFAELNTMLDGITANRTKLTGAWAITSGGIAEGICKMAFGNGLGFEFDGGFANDNDIFAHIMGGILITAKGDSPCGGKLVGKVTEAAEIKIEGGSLPLGELKELWLNPIDEVFPIGRHMPTDMPAPTYSYTERLIKAPAIKVAKPRVLVTAFPGTNSEYDTAIKFEEAGAIADIFVLRNGSAEILGESVLELEKKIKQSQIIAVPGGFSGGDEPDGSGKFIAAVYRNPRVRDAIHEMLRNRDGLMLGICNGFQALIKTGLLPFGEIDVLNEASATLTNNAIARHQSKMVATRVSSVLSPWMSKCNVGEVYQIPISHGEGRLVASDELIAKLAANGQIATQYVDLEGNVSSHIDYAPNSAVHAIEGITSPDGRVFGKMCHCERVAANTFKNIPNVEMQPIFEGGVEYFR